MITNILNWVSNINENAKFFQMVGSDPNLKSKYFITKMKNDEKYLLKITDTSISLFFHNMEDAKIYCEYHFKNLN